MNQLIKSKILITLLRHLRHFFRYVSFFRMYFWNESDTQLKRHFFFIMYPSFGCSFEMNPIRNIDDLQKLFTLVKVAYAMLVITLLLMMWASVARMHEMPVQYPPCFFNPLCTCSKAIPDLGIVACYNVPMPRIPQSINSSKVFMLQLENNGLRFLQPQYLMNTGTYVTEYKQLHKKLYKFWFFTIYFFLKILSFYLKMIN